MGNTRKIQPNRRKSNKRRVPVKQRVQSVGTGAKSLASKAGPIVVLAVIGLAIPYFALQAYYFAVGSDYFAIETIRVTGNKQAEAPDLLEIAGLETGLNVFDVDPERMQILVATHPWVVNAQVEVELPRTVIIKVDEHVPSAILVDEEQMWLIDQNGVAFKALESTDNADALFGDLPFMTGQQPEDLKLENGKALYTDALLALESYETAGLHKVAPLSEVHMDRVLGISFVTQGGVEIRLGRGVYDERLRRLAAVMKSLEEDGMRAEYILVDHEEYLDRVSVGMAPVNSMDAEGADRW